jgi:thiamine-phosphate pyrophosphorylase
VLSIAARYSGCVTQEQPSLPLLWLLSDQRNDAELDAALRALPTGSGFVFRHYHLDPAARRARFDVLAALARALGHVVILSGAGDWGADGHYGPPERLGAGLRLATAHDAGELQAASAARADAVFLSPVFPTGSHPGAKTLGVNGFHALARQSQVPVIALGGMTHERARELDWPRWGAIDGLGSTNVA